MQVSRGQLAKIRYGDSPNNDLEQSAQNSGKDAKGGDSGDSSMKD